MKLTFKNSTINRRNLFDYTVTEDTKTRNRSNLGGNGIFSHTTLNYIIFLKTSVFS